MRAVKILVTAIISIGHFASAHVDAAAVRAARAEVRAEVQDKIIREREKLTALIGEIEAIEVELEAFAVRVNRDKTARKVTVAISAGLLAATGFVVRTPLDGQVGYVGKFMQSLMTRAGIWVAGVTNAAGLSTKTMRYHVDVEPEEIPLLQSELANLRVKLAAKLAALGEA